MLGAQLFVVALFIAVHLGAGRLRFLDGIPRSRWLSLCGGMAVAYVFLHLLPELSAAQHSLAQTPGLAWLQHHAYLVALLGLAAFYGLERWAKAQQAGDGAAPTRPAEGEAGPSALPPAAYRLHIGAFALYNALVGYLLVHREEAGAASLGTYALAMALHFVVNDYGLRQHHRGDYARHGRWLLSAAVLAGWLLGLALALPEAIVHALFALLAGGVILNVLKEELPEERRSRFGPFAGGAAAYAALLLAL